MPRNSNVVAFLLEYNIDVESTLQSILYLLDQSDCRYFVRLQKEHSGCKEEDLRDLFNMPGSNNYF